MLGGSTVHFSRRMATINDKRSSSGWVLEIHGRIYRYRPRLGAPILRCGAASQEYQAHRGDQIMHDSSANGPRLFFSR